MRRRKPTVKHLGRQNPSRSVQPRCCTPRKSRLGKASSFPTRPRPPRPQWPRGLTRTKARSAARAVARPPSGRRDQLHLNRWRRRRSPESGRLLLPPVHQCPPNQIRRPGRRCGFLMAIRRPPSSLAPVTAQADGMPRRMLTLPHSAIAGGCSAKPPRRMPQSGAKSRLKSRSRPGRMIAAAEIPNGRVGI
jgi:hypothetical protein